MTSTRSTETARAAGSGVHELRPLRRIARTAVVFVVAIVVVVVLSPVFALWLLLSLIGWVARVVHDRLEPRAVRWGEIIQFDPKLGWKGHPDVHAAAKADLVFRFTTDEDGWRRTRSFEDSDVVVFGDSFAFGWGVDDRHHFANIGGGGGGGGGGALRVKAVGVVAYNLVQELLIMEDVASGLAGKVVVWLIYVANDLSGNLMPQESRYRAPFLRSAPGIGWEVVTDHLSEEPWPWTLPPQQRWGENLATHLELCCGGFRADRTYAACAHLIERGSQICEAVGARLVVATVPDLYDFEPAERLRAQSPDPESFDPNRPNTELRRVCQSHDVTFVPLKEHIGPAHFKHGDPHWNEDGHRRIAALLQDVCRAVDHPSGNASPSGLSG